jgi:hypothetical protein
VKKTASERHEMDIRIKITAVQVCVTCGLEAGAYTTAGLCARCENARRNTLITRAKVQRDRGKKK